ncbi:MAG: nucleotidyltransferase [Saprospiraceae bacterium]|nr:nucleotidyltransferase [Saprospiraceae bacterium]MDW8230247.1 nucleotidyltransferase [Saprospiraceae bacterium]
MHPTLVILAAGIGSRYGGLKQVDGVGPKGEAILEFSLHDAQQAGFGKAVIVLRKAIEEAFRQRIGARVERWMPVEYVFQEMDTALEWLPAIPPREKPWGTGHAILAARACVQEPFATINADDFYGAEAFRVMARFLQDECAPDLYGMVAYRLGNTLSENGAVSRGVCSVSPQGFLTDVVERTGIERLDDGIGFTDEVGHRHLLPTHTPVSMNFWGFHPSLFEYLDAQFRAFVQQHMEHPRAEFYIPSAISQLLHEGRVRVRVQTCESPWYGVTYPADKAIVQAALAALYPQGL